MMISQEEEHREGTIRFRKSAASLARINTESSTLDYTPHHIALSERKENCIFFIPTRNSLVSRRFLWVLETREDYNRCYLETLPYFSKISIIGNYVARSRYGPIDIKLSFFGKMVSFRLICSCQISLKVHVNNCRN